MSASERLLVAAIDVGTTYSGYAFSFRDTPEDIHTNPNWVAGSEKLISMKTPTCVLLDPNQEFHSFGFEAENKYADLAEDEEHHGWYLFRRFKMALYETKNLTFDTPIEDIAGKKVPAITVFTHTIQFLKDHLFRTLTSRATGVVESDIEYVLTVPAIWDEQSKQFMKMAAKRAGIDSSQLQIALEPEAASIWCQVETDCKLSVLSKPGSAYMVVDLGGGTADITVHEKMSDGSLKEIEKANGGSWGGNEVDKAYIDMLTTVIGRQNMEQFKQDHTGDYLDILRDFETKKRTFSTASDRKVTMKLPAELIQIAENDGLNMKERVAKSPYCSEMVFTKDKLRFTPFVAAQLFEKPLQSLISHVQILFEQPNVSKVVDAILLVGGYSECELVKETFKTHFPGKPIIVPKDAGLAVVKGAVRFGHMPKVISTRIARYTFGRDGWLEFDPLEHDEKFKVKLRGKDYCSNVFYGFVRTGEEIPVGKTIRSALPQTYPGQKGFSIKLYSSTASNPKYIDDTCTLIGTLEALYPETSSKSELLECYLDIEFGNTTIKATVFFPKSDNSFEKEIDCFF